MVSGRMFTGRDAVHAHLMKHDPPVDLRGGVLYHCGPVVVKEGDRLARDGRRARPTSIREEPYQAEIIKRYGVRVVIGKGGMGAKTLGGAQGVTARSTSTPIGGAAQFYARGDHRRRGRLADGVRHARSDVASRRSSDFPAIVTMDAHGNSLHKDIEQQSGERLWKPSGPRPYCEQPRAEIGHTSSTFSLRIAHIRSCRFTTGSQCWTIRSILSPTVHFRRAVS